MYIVEYFEYDNDQRVIARGLTTYENKRDAWLDFKSSITEFFRGKDFWEDFNWDDNTVESTHYAEDGYNVYFLRKWDDFDKNVSLAWKVDDTRYKSLEDLWINRPDFAGCYKMPDEPYIVSKDGKKIAWLSIKTEWE